MAKVKVLSEKLHVEGVWYEPGSEVEIAPPALDNLLRDSRVELVPEEPKSEEPAPSPVIDGTHAPESPKPE